MAADAQQSPSYTAVPGLLFRSWDDTLTVVFDPSAAKTHLLSAAAADLLRTATNAPLFAADLMAEDASQPFTQDAPEPTTASSQRVHEALDSLERAGLLRPCPCPLP